MTFFFLNFQECEKESYLCNLVLQWDYQMTPVFCVDLILPVEDTCLYGCVFIRLCLPIKEPNSVSVGYLTKSIGPF